MKKIYLIVGLLILGAAIIWKIGGNQNIAPTDSTTKGHVVFSLTDDASPLDDIQSIFLAVSEVRIHSQTEGWVTVSDEAKEFDLLRLKENGINSLLAEGDVKPGTYDQVRLTISKVTVLSSGTTEEAKLPSNDLKIIGAVTVTAQKTASVNLDVLADQSFHRTGSGRIIFAPVVKLESRNNTDASIKAGNIVVVTGGTVETNATVGMDENGETKSDFVLGGDKKVKLEIVGEAIRVMAVDEKETGVKITAKAATDLAVQNGKLDTILSVKLMTREGIKVWRVVGTKNLEITNVYIDVTSGAVVAVE